MNNFTQNTYHSCTPLMFSNPVIVLLIILVCVATCDLRWAFVKLTTV